MFEIEDIQPAERAGFPPAYFPVQEFLAGLLVYLSPQKIAEMFPEKLFKLNETKEFKVLEIDSENRKIALSLKDVKKTKTTK